MRFVTILIAALLFAANSFAENGKIAGKISDKTYGDAIIGASVSVQGLSIGTVTDVDGNFILNNVPTGEYVIEVKYIGFQQKNIEGVAVKAGQTTNVNVVMEESSSTKMDEVVITARLDRETVNALYIQQRNNVSLSSGISADIIQRSPDKNTGEVLKRVSGASIQDNKFVVIRGLNDRYNMAMVNNALMPSTEPNRKAFSFDVIPSDVIDNIVINKTATPDLPGDFAGGVVKVLTKDIPERNFFNVNLGAGYNSQTTFKDFKTTPDQGAAFLAFPAKDHQLSSSWGQTQRDYLTLTNQQRFDANKELPQNSFTTTTKAAMPNSSLRLSAGNTQTFKNGGKLGTIASASLSNSQTTINNYKRGKFLSNNQVHTLSTEDQYLTESNMAAMLNIAYSKGKSRISFKNLYNKIYDKKYIDRQGYSTSSFQDNLLYATKPTERAIMNNQLEGSHAIGTKNIKIDWNLNYSGMNSGMNDFRSAEYARSMSGGFVADPVYDAGKPYTLVDRDSRRFFSNQKDNNYGANLDVTYPFEIAGRKQTLKAGYMGLFKNRSFAARTFQYRLYDYTTPLKDEVLTKPVETIFNYDNLGTDRLELNEITAASDKYDATGNLNAAYVMLDNMVGEKLRVIWGGRYEAYTQVLNAFTRSGDSINLTTPFNNLLPSANITYDVNKNSKFRFAVSQTVNRPEFREIAPFTFIDYENIWSVVGNPNLVRATITNYDLRYEIYPNPGEAVTFGAFYKNFMNPIEAKLDPGGNLDYLLFGYANAASAYAAGFEFEARKNMGFIGSAPWLNNFTASTNLSYIYSRVDTKNIVGAVSTVGTKIDRPLQGQSPYIVNLSLMYNSKKSGWAASALYNRIGHRIAYVGSATIPTTWENGRNIVDLQVSKQLFKGKGEIKLTISDLLNSPHTLYWNTDTKDAYKKGNSTVGLGNDQIFQQYRTGTGASLGFVYRLGK